MRKTERKNGRGFASASVNLRSSAFNNNNDNGGREGRREGGGSDTATLVTGKTSFLHFRPSCQIGSSELAKKEEEEEDEAINRPPTLLLYLLIIRH